MFTFSEAALYHDDTATVDDGDGSSERGQTQNPPFLKKDNQTNDRCLVSLVHNSHSFAH